MDIVPGDYSWTHCFREHFSWGNAIKTITSVEGLSSGQNVLWEYHILENGPWVFHLVIIDVFVGENVLVNGFS